jgi:hypothetical protein
MKVFHAVAFILVAITGSLMVSLAMPGVSRADAKSDQAGEATIAAAAHKLAAEYAAYLGDANKKVNDECSYFTDDPAPEVTPDIVLAALRRDYSQDPRIDAYVKWQFLSALPEKLSDPQELQLRRIYASQRLTFSRPGLSSQDQALLLQMGGQHRQDVEPVNEQFSAAVDEALREGNSELQYRNELAKRLTPSHDVLLAELADAYDRASHGISAETVAKKFQDDLSVWMSGTPDRDDEMQLAGVIHRMRMNIQQNVSTRFLPYYATELSTGKGESQKMHTEQAKFFSVKELFAIENHLIRGTKFDEAGADTVDKVASDKPAAGN